MARALPRVLIVDDDPAVGRSLARVLARYAKVDVVASGEEALAAIEHAQVFDLVMCDVMMPGMTGPQLFEQVRAVDPRKATPFVFMTGGASSEEQSRLTATGVKWLLKPVELSAVRELLPID
jgi:CheY-like chemotaxis protein